jgi:hypothetical protein
LFQTDSSRPSRPFPDFPPTAQQGLRRDAPLRFLVVAEAEPQELPLDWSSHRTLGLVYFELEPSHEEARDVRHHPLSRSLAADVDIAVSGWFLCRLSLMQQISRGKFDLMEVK